MKGPGIAAVCIAATVWHLVLGSVLLIGTSEYGYYLRCDQYGARNGIATQWSSGGGCTVSFLGLRVPVFADGE